MRRLNSDEYVHDKIYNTEFFIQQKILLKNLISQELVGNFTIMPERPRWKGRSEKNFLSFLFLSEFWPKIFILLIMVFKICALAETGTRIFLIKRLRSITALGAGGQINLNFLAHPYEVGILNPWCMANKPWSTLNSKINFEFYYIYNT